MSRILTGEDIESLKMVDYMSEQRLQRVVNDVVSCSEWENRS